MTARNLDSQGTDLVLLVKRTGIDKSWTVAPYAIPSRDYAKHVADFLQRAWGIPFEWKVVEA